MPTDIVKAIDHFVLTVEDIDASCEFYCRVVGAERVNFGDGRVALQIGNQKINLHRRGSEFAPHAARPVPGSADFCFVAAAPIEPIAEHLRRAGIEIILGPTAKTGAVGPITSIYFRDPDGNLVEIGSYDG
jgi:catechol 2,3-dioxygenase-like lactoylglutathione lyase family enzyme